LTTLAIGPDGQPLYALEGSLFMGGAVIQWLRDGLGLLENAADSEALARQVESSDGVFLVPAFTGLGAPYWDPEARGAIVGLTRGSGRAHVVRAGLESIAFSNAELIELLRGAAGVPLKQLRVDGGATANDFLMQTQADLGGVRVERPRDVEATARGAALLAGLGAGVWSSPDQIPQPQMDHFEPTLEEAQRAQRLAEWRRAVARVRSDRT
jgi:glycerol kinase